MNINRNNAGEIIKKDIENAKNARQTWEVEAFLNMHGINGNTDVFFNTVTGQIESSLITSVNDNKKKKINEARKILREVKNIITGNSPRWQVKNSEAVEATQEEKDVAHNFLNVKYRELKLKQKIKDALDYGLLRTWCLSSVMWDKSKNDVEVRLHDPLDCYPDPASSEPEGWGYVTITSSVDIEKLANMEKYKHIKKEIERESADSKTAESELKDSFNHNQGQIETNGVIRKQHFKVINKNGKNKVVLIEMIKELIINIETLPYENLSEIFSIFYPERRAGQMYFPAWMTDVISLNDLLDRNFKNIDDYDQIMTKGRWMKNKATKIKSKMTKEHGQVVEVDGGNLTHLPVPQLPASTFQHQASIKSYMMDLGGAHGSSIIENSSASTSGKALSMKVAQAQQNSAEPVDNLQEFMSDIGKLILACASKHYTEIRKVYYDDEHKEEEVDMDVIGDEAMKALEGEAKNNKNTEANKMVKGKSKAKRIKSFDNIIATIVPSSAFSDLQAYEMLLSLKQAQVKVPDTALIEASKLGNAREFIRKWEEENAKDEGDGDILIAKGKIQKIIKEGVEEIPSPNDDLDVHLAIIGQTIEAIGQDHPAYQMLMQYAKACEQLKKEKAQGQNPQKMQMQGIDQEMPPEMIEK